MIKKVLFSILIMMFLFSACTVNEPKLPAWDTEWTLYLPTDNFLMEEIINDSTLVSSEDESGTPIIAISLSDSTDWERIESDDLVMEPEVNRFVTQVGEITLEDPPAIESEKILLEDVMPPQLLAAGDTLPPYPDFDFTAELEALEFDEFKNALIADGDLWLTFYNNLFLTIKAGMEITIYNNGGAKEKIATLRFNEAIEEGDSVRSNIVPLDDKRISNKFIIEYFIPVSGSDTMQVLTEERKQGYIISELHIRDITVLEAVAQIPEQEFSQTDSLDMSDQEHQLKSALIEKGSIEFQVNNSLAIDADVRVRMPNFVKNGEIKTINQYLTSGQTHIENIDLSGWEIVHHENPGQSIDAIYYFTEARIPGTDEFVTISYEDSVVADVFIDSLYFERIEGVLDRTEFTFEPVELDTIDLFENVQGNIRLEDLTMTFTFQNQIDIPINVNLKITGYHFDKSVNMITDSVAVNVNEHIQASGISPTTEIVLDQSYANPNSIVDLLEIFPTSIRISGEAFIEGEGAVSSGDGLRVLYDIESPLTLNIINTITYETEIDSIKKADIDEEDRERLTEDMHHATTRLLLRNEVPIGAAVRFYMATDSTLLFTDSISDSTKKIILEANVDAGRVGSAGYVDNPTESTVTISLTEKQLQIFKDYQPLYTRQVVEVKPTNGSVRIRKTDQIEFEALVSVKFRINPEDDE